MRRITVIVQRISFSEMPPWNRCYDASLHVSPAGFQMLIVSKTGIDAVEGAKI